jgi:hypothetical protein
LCGSTRGGTVLDIVYLALALGTFALMIFYARWAAQV